MAFTRPILFLCHCKGWSWFVLRGKVRENTHFCALYYFILDYILIFRSLTFASLRLFVLGGLCWDTVHMSVSLPPDKLADIQQLAFSLLQTQPCNNPLGHVLLRKANFFANGHS